MTRLCLDVLRSARVRREAYVGPWLPEPVPTGDGALGPLETVEQRDSLALGYLLLLERLGPAERAVFVLREAFGLPYAEVADAVGRSPAACRQLYARARARLGDLPPSLPAAGRRALLDRFVALVADGDVAGLTALLLRDAVLVSDGGGQVSTARRPVRGGNRVARFLLGIGRRGQGHAVAVVEVNGGPALAVTGPRGFVLALQPAGDAGSGAGRVGAVYLVAAPDKLVPLAGVRAAWKGEPPVPSQPAADQGARR